MTRRRREILAAEILIVIFWLGPILLYAVGAFMLICLAEKYL